MNLQKQSFIKSNVITNNEIDKIKIKLINFLYWIYSIFVWFALAGSMFRTYDLGIRTLNYIQIGLTFVFLIAFSIRKKIPYLLKVNILLIITFLIGSTSIVTFGLFSQGAFFLLLFTILTSVLINTTWSIASFIISIATMVISGFLFVNNIIPEDDLISNYSRTISAWTLAILIFSMVTWITIVFWKRILDFLINKIEYTSKHEETLNKVNKLLSKEIERRKTTEHLLNEQYQESKILNREYQEINKQLQDANVKLEKSNSLIKEAKEKVQAADKLKSSFLSNMSYEIRTPMNAIVGFATLIADSDLSKEEHNQYLSIIQSSTNHLLSTISDIINLAKIESGQFTLYPKLIDIDIIIDAITAKYTQEIKIRKNNNIELIIDKKFTKPCKVIVDEESLKQIVNKLIDNAIKFTEQGYIKVTIDINLNGFFTAIIEDSGIGIPEHIKSDIFEIFRQLEAGNSRKIGGTGIGLSIVKGLIELLNGTIEFTSQSGKGTTFTIAVPVINQEHKKNDETTLKGKTILIIGKQTWDNREINLILQEINTTLIYVETGFQAIDTFKEHPEIDLVIMNMLIQDMNAMEVTKILKKAAPQLPVLAHISENTSPIHKTSEKQAIYDEIIETPIQKNDFIKTISKHINKNSTNQL